MVMRHSSRLYFMFRPCRSILPVSVYKIIQKEHFPEWKWESEIVLCSNLASNTLKAPHRPLLWSLSWNKRMIFSSPTYSVYEICCNLAHAVTEIKAKPIVNHNQRKDTEDGCRKLCCDNIFKPTSFISPMFLILPVYAFLKINVWLSRRRIDNNTVLE